MRTEPEVKAIEMLNSDASWLDICLSTGLTVDQLSALRRDTPQETASQLEIAMVNRNQAILFGLWDALPVESKTLETFKLFNREFLELSKARRALGGLDAPTRHEQKIETTTVESGSIDSEVTALVAKLGLNDRKPAESHPEPRLRHDR